MKRTKKYLAAEKALGKHLTGANEKIYAHMESLGYWWDQKSGTWKQSEKPSSSIFETSKGEPTGVVKIRIMAHPDDLYKAIGYIQDTNFRIVEISEKTYPNRNGAGSRIYITATLGGAL